jgi:exopolyphosphatase/guanosine-5'-triphosphate,3'-diphosphate pyrophosphatase
MKYASIDIGTNTVLLLIADWAGNRLEDVCDISTITRLGEGLKGAGVLSEAAMDRTFGALKSYRDLARHHGAKELHCVGTAAMREGRNSEEFIRRVEDELGISIGIISARDEAYYTWLSVTQDHLLPDGRFVIVDIGGGSTEIIAGDSREFADFVSLPVGSVKLTEMFIKNDPPADGEISRLEGYLKETVAAPFEGRGCAVVGTAGTITNVASIVLGLDSWDKARVHGLRISSPMVAGVIERLKPMTVAQRRAVRGMEPGREDILLQGALLLKEIMTHFGAEELVVSANGVRYGVLYESIRQ